MRQRQLGVHLLQSAVLDLELLELAQLRDDQVAVAGFPVVQRSFADAVLASALCLLHARLPLLQHRDDLLFAESGLLHECSRVWKTLLPHGPIRQGGYTTSAV